MNPEESLTPSLRLPFPQKKNVSRTFRRAEKKLLPVTISLCNAWQIEPSQESLNPGNLETRFGYPAPTFSPISLPGSLRQRNMAPSSLNPHSPPSPLSSGYPIPGESTPFSMLLNYHPITRQKSTARTT